MGWGDNDAWNGKGPIGWANAAITGLPPAVSAVLAEPAEEKGSVPARHDRGADGQGSLLSLRLGDDFR